MGKKMHRMMVVFPQSVTDRDSDVSPHYTRSQKIFVKKYIE